MDKLGVLKKKKNYKIRFCWDTHSREDLARLIKSGCQYLRQSGVKQNRNGPKLKFSPLRMIGSEKTPETKMPILRIRSDLLRIFLFYPDPY